jgi:hypothetical protein
VTTDLCLVAPEKNALPDHFVGQGIPVSQDVQAITFPVSPFEPILR